MWAGNPFRTRRGRPFSTLHLKVGTREGDGFFAWMDGMGGIIGGWGRCVRQQLRYLMGEAAPLFCKWAMDLSFNRLRIGSGAIFPLKA